MPTMDDIMDCLSGACYFEKSVLVVAASNPTGRKGKGFQHQRRLVRVVGDAVWVDERTQYVHEADERGTQAVDR